MDDPPNTPARSVRGLRSLLAMVCALLVAACFSHNPYDPADGRPEPYEHRGRAVVFGSTELPECPFRQGDVVRVFYGTGRAPDLARAAGRRGYDAVILVTRVYGPGPEFEPIGVEGTGVYFTRDDCRR